MSHTQDTIVQHHAKFKNSTSKPYGHGCRVRIAGYQVQKGGSRHMSDRLRNPGKVVLPLLTNQPHEKRSKGLYFKSHQHCSRFQYRLYMGIQKIICRLLGHRWSVTDAPATGPLFRYCKRCGRYEDAIPGGFFREFTFKKIEPNTITYYTLKFMLCRNIK